jgi:hypothetical protein
MPFFGGGGSSGSGSGTQTTYPVLSGSGAPGSSLGSNGQVYIDTSTDTLYGPKTGGSWGSGIVLTGADYSQITNLPTTFTPATHVHAISEITDLQTELDGKTATGHAHVVADVTDLQTELDLKAPTTYVDQEISILVSTAPSGLNDLAKISAAINNDTAFSTTITNLVNAKADATHVHELDDLTNVNTGTPATGQVISWSGSQWQATTLDEPPEAVSLSGLQDVSNVSPVAGQFLSYNGNNWSPTSIQVDFSTSSGNLVASPATGTFEVRGVSATQSGAIQLNCSENSHSIKIVGPPHSANASYTLTLPDDVGSVGQVLQTDGAGELSWLTVGGSGSAVTFSSVPTTETSTGTVGEMALDPLHLYVCVATNTWKRIALQDFSGNTGGGGGSTTGIFVTQQPAGGASQNGLFNLSISATVPAGSTLNYQWQKYNTSTTAWDDVSGAVYRNLSLTNLASSDDGSRYRCFLTSTGHSDFISSEAIISVSDSGVQGVTSTAPTLLFDRNTSSNLGVAIFKGSGKNWTYPGWTLIKEETYWEYSHSNLGFTSTTTGKSSFPTRSGDTWNYYLVGVPGVYESHFPNLEMDTGLASIYAVTGLHGTLISGSSPTHWADNENFEHTSWNDTVSDSGKWNRAARFRTRVVLTRTINGVEEQATTNWSQWSNWRSDPAGNILDETSPTVFTTQPSTNTITLPVAGGTLTNSAQIAGSNKRYAWSLGLRNYDIRGTLSHDTSSNVSSQFIDLLNLSIDSPKLSAVGTYDLRCLGAADWNKATYSNATPLVLESTDNSNVIITEMGGNLTGTLSTFVSTSNGYTSSIVGVATFEGTWETSGGTSENFTDGGILVSSSNFHTSTIFRDGGIDIRLEQTTSYGSTSGVNWDHVWTKTQTYQSNGGHNRLLWNANLTSRIRWRLNNITLLIDGTNYTNVTSVWSDWIY